MKRSLALATLALFFYSLASSAGEAPPYLEFVRGLRAQQMPDYALQYLQQLSVKPPPELAALLPLEMAKARMDLAQLAPNETRKLALYAQARSELLAFLEKNPKHLLAAEANLDIARLAALLGKGQLSRARRQETTEAERAELAKARMQFQEAGKQLKTAAERIDAQLAAHANPKTPEEQKAKQDLTKARMQAELEQAINLIDQAQSYHLDDPAEERKKRGAILKQAMTTLGKLSRQDEKNPLCWEARVWLGRCHQENDDPLTARKIYGEVIAEDGEAARAANRLARYFRMQVIHDDKNEKDPLGKIQASAEQWLDRYANCANTPEGHGVRYELANVYYQKALKLPKAQQLGPKGKEYFTKAQRQFQVLEQSKTDFSEQARRKRLEIILLTSQEIAKGTVDKLRNFDECFLRAQVEIAKMNQLAKKDVPPEKQEAERRHHFQTIIEALHRSLELADAKVPPDERSDARYLLAYAYLASGDPYRAAVVGEELARAEPKAPRAPLAAAYALYAYSQVINHERQTPGADLEGHRHRLRRLAEYIEKTWPDEPAADDARFQLGLLFLQSKKHADAVETLERISPAYGEAIRAQYQLAMAAFQAQREELKPPAGKASYEERGTRALKNIPDLPPGADAATTEVFLLARLELSRVHYAEKKFAEMQALLEKLAQIIDQATGLDKEARVSLTTAVRARKLLAQYGVCEELYGKGEYTKVRETLDAIVKQLDDAEKIRAAAINNDPRSVYALLGLALRANIQDAQMDRAREILAVLQKGDPDISRQVLVQLVFQLEKQIQVLRGQEGEDAKKQLDHTTGQFAAFLAELGKQPQLDAETSFFLAQSYATLEKHQEAAELLTKIPEPKAFKLAEPQPPPEPADPADKAAAEAYKKKLEAHAKEMAVYKKQADAHRREVQIYRASRILLVRALRLSKDYKRALAEADAILKQQWTQVNMELQKERIFILEDQGFYGGKGGAVTAWFNLMDRMKNELSNPKVRELYFECYFNFSRCMYLNAQKVTDPKKKVGEIRRAAQSMVNLKRAMDERKALDAKAGKPNPEMDKLEEVAWKRFDVLLEREPELKRAFAEVSGAS